MAAPKSDTKELILRPETEVVEWLEKNFEELGHRSKNSLGVELLELAVRLIRDSLSNVSMPSRMVEMRKKYHKHEGDPYTTSLLGKYKITPEEAKDPILAAAIAEDPEVFRVLETVIDKRIEALALNRVQELINDALDRRYEEGKE